ncbi:MAG TPA: hypothetical protein VE135_13065 [Pyrinomonadaceae bacterium]|nr:hypothetical protein [Pyrinomonadaceae bacterium]
MKLILIAAALMLLALNGCRSLVAAPPDATADNLTLTSATGPLPPAAYKAGLSFAYEPPARMHPGERASLHLLVKNLSSSVWPYAGQADGKYHIRLGNRWLGSNGATTDDGRGSLSYDLRPGDEAEVLIVVTAPRQPGDYTVVFDLVQEQVAWFSQTGSETLRLKITVE